MPSFCWLNCAEPLTTITLPVEPAFFIVQPFVGAFATVLIAVLLLLAGEMYVPSARFIMLYEPSVRASNFHIEAFVLASVGPVMAASTPLPVA